MTGVTDSRTEPSKSLTQERTEMDRRRDPGFRTGLGEQIPTWNDGWRVGPKRYRSTDLKGNDSTCIDDPFNKGGQSGVGLNT